MRTPPLLLLLPLLACQGPAPDTGEALAWTTLAPEPLSAFTPGPGLALPDDGAAGHLRVARRAALTFVIRPEAGLVRVVDERLRHARQPLCVDPARVGQAARPEWQGGCEAGLVELDRGVLRMAGVVDLAADEEALEAWLISASGRVRRVELDPASADGPLGWLRPGLTLDTGQPLTGGVVADGRLWLATAEGVAPLEGEALGPTLPYEDPTLLSGEGGLWVLDAEGLHLPDGRLLAAEGLAAAAGGRGLAWSEGWLESSEGWRLEHPERPDALALDPMSGVAWVQTAGGLRRVSPDGAVLDVEAAPADALAVSHTHDLLRLEREALHATFDALSLADGRPPLHLTPIAFLETPRSRQDPILCDAPRVQGALAQGLWRAAGGLDVLADLPGAPGLGVTPRLAEAAWHCGLDRSLRALVEGRGEAGLLVHDRSDCSSASCLEEFLQERNGRLRAAGLEPTWVGGASGELADGLAASLALGYTRRLFLSQGLRPGVGPEHPLFKEPWPLLPGDGVAAFRASSAAELPEGSPSGGQALYPGDPVRAFAASACEGLMVWECIALSQGSDTFTDADVEVLVLLAMHAAARRGEGVSSWSWHIPDLTAQDYSEGCARGAGGEWVAEDEGCQATRLQDLHWTLHQRLVLNDLARWTAPSALPWPE